MAINLINWGTNLGTRELGGVVRRELLNSLEFNAAPISVSFKGIFMISSSFADECFGKLIAGIGVDQFKKCFIIDDLNDPHLKKILNRAVKNRILQEQQRST